MEKETLVGLDTVKKSVKAKNLLSFTNLCINQEDRVLPVNIICPTLSPMALNGQKFPSYQTLQV